MTELQTTRRNTRRDVEYLAHASNKNTHLIAARVLDVSCQGAFLERTSAGALPSPGEELAVDFFVNGLGSTLTTKAKVAWAGYSSKHKCEGIGLQFSEPTQLPEFN